MQLIIFLLVAALLFGMNTTTGTVDDTVGEPDTTPETDTTDEGTDETTDETTDGDTDETDETTDEGTDETADTTIVGNTYDLVIDNQGLNMTFESDGSLTIGEFPDSYDGNYEITEAYLYVNVINLYYDETVALELTYDDLTLDVISGVVNDYALIVDDGEISEEDLAEFNEQFIGLPYTLELTNRQ